MTPAWRCQKGKRKAEHRRDSGGESGQEPPTAGGKAMNHGKEEKRAAENQPSHQPGAAQRLRHRPRRIESGLSSKTPNICGLLAVKPPENHVYEKAVSLCLFPALPTSSAAKRASD